MNELNFDKEKRERKKKKEHKNAVANNIYFISSL